MFRCDRELLSRYKDDEVTPQERRQLEAHIAACPDCAATLAAYRNIGRSISGLGRRRAPARLRAELYGQIARRNGRSGRMGLFGSIISGVALAGTAVILILVLSPFFRGMNEAPTAVLATAVYPLPDSSNIPPSSTIEVQFNRQMDPKSVEDSLAITPTLNATAIWQGEKLVLKPVSGLEANTDYVVSIGSNAKDVQGKPIRETVVLRFSTGALEAPANTAIPSLAIMAASPVTPSPVSSPEPGTPTPTATPTSVPTVAPSTLVPRLVLVDPKSPSTLFLVTSTGTLYKTVDGGAAWRVVGSGLPNVDFAINSLIVDPQVSQVMYAGTSMGAYRSTDGGQSWFTINNGLPLTSVTGGSTSVQALAIHPANRLVLYASAAGGFTLATTYRSTDAGASWSPVGSMNANAFARSAGADSLIFDPETPSTMYAGTTSGAYRSTDAGATWLSIGNGISGSISSLVLHPKDRAVLYAASQNGIFKTTNSGADWQRLNVNTTDTLLRALSIAPDGTLYAATSWREPAGRHSPAIRSTDGGNSWSMVQGGLENTEPTTFAFDPTNPRTVYAGTLSGVFKSIDGGNRWTQVAFNVLPTPAPQPEITVTGTISEASQSLQAVTVLADEQEVWQVVLNQDPQQPTQIVLSDGRPATFADLRLSTRVAVKGKVNTLPRPQAEKVLAADSMTILTDRPTPTVTMVPPPIITATARIGYVYDPGVGSYYNGDWPTHLQNRGFSVTQLDIRAESGFDIDGYDLVVISWLSGQWNPANIAKLQNVKAPILDASPLLAEKLGLGKVYDSGNPGRTLYGKTITIEEGGGALTLGYSGEVTLASDTLYRVPILASGAVLATVNDEQQGVRNAPVWTMSEKRAYFGFWYSKDGTNHNEHYWDLFDRTVDTLLGRPLVPAPIPTPSVTDK